MAYKPNDMLADKIQNQLFSHIEEKKQQEVWQ